MLGIAPGSARGSATPGCSKKGRNMAPAGCPKPRQGQPSNRCAQSIRALSFPLIKSKTLISALRKPLSTTGGARWGEKEAYWLRSYIGTLFFRLGHSPIQAMHDTLWTAWIGGWPNLKKNCVPIYDPRRYQLRRNSKSLSRIVNAPGE